MARIDGPLTVCFSSHDRALSVFYPLASAAVGDDKSGLEDPLARWRAMGSLGAFNVVPQMLGNVGTSYPFKVGEILILATRSRKTPNVWGKSRCVEPKVMARSALPGSLIVMPAVKLVTSVANLGFKVTYPVLPAATNLDSSDVVIAGDSSLGAHSDIFHAELARVAASAGGLSATAVS